MLSLTAPQAWTTLCSRMQQARCDFTPCAFRRRLYLCGGGFASAIDVFDLDTQRFAAGPDVCLPKTGSCVAWVAEGLLTIVSEEATHRVDIATSGTLLATDTHAKVEVPARCSPTVCGKYVYWVHQYGCVRAEVGQLSLTQFPV